MAGQGFASPVYWQISSLASSLAKKNADSVSAEILHHVSSYGDDARIYAIACLLSGMDLKDGRNHSQAKAALLKQLMDEAAAMPNFTTLLLRSVDNGLRMAANQAGDDAEPQEGVAQVNPPKTWSHMQPAAEKLAVIARAAHLSVQTRVAMAIGVAHSESPAVAEGAMSYLQNLVLALFGPDTRPEDRLSPTLLHAALHVIRTPPVPSASSAQVTNCLKALLAAHQGPAQAVATLPVLQGTVALVDFTVPPRSSAADKAAAAALRASPGVSAALSAAGPAAGVDAPRQDAELREAVQEEEALLAPGLGGARAVGVVLDAGPAATATAEGFAQLLRSTGLGPDAASGYEGKVTPPVVAALLVGMANWNAHADAQRPGSKEPASAPSVAVVAASQATAFGGAADEHASLRELAARGVRAEAEAGRRIAAAYAGPGSAAAAAAAAAAADEGLPPARQGAVVLTLGSRQAAGDGPDRFDTALVVDVVRSLQPSLAWDRVLRCLDQPAVISLSAAGAARGADATPVTGPLHAFSAFQEVVAAIRRGLGDGRPLSAAPLVQRWRHAPAQLAAIVHAIHMDQRELTFATVGSSNLLAPVAGSRFGCGALNQAWCAVGVYEALDRLAHSASLHNEATAALDEGRRLCPDLVMLGLATVRARSNDLLGGGDAGAGHVLRRRLLASLVSQLIGPLMINGAGFPPAIAVPLRESVPRGSRDIAAQATGSGRASASSAVRVELLKRLWAISPELSVSLLCDLGRSLSLRAAQAGEPPAPPASHVPGSASPLVGAPQRRFVSLLCGAAAGLQVVGIPLDQVLGRAPTAELALALGLAVGTRAVAADIAQRSASPQPAPLVKWLRKALSNPSREHATRDKGRVLRFLERLGVDAPPPAAQRAAEARSLTEQVQQPGASPLGCPTTVVGAAWTCLLAEATAQERPVIEERLRKVAVYFPTLVAAVTAPPSGGGAGGRSFGGGAAATAGPGTNPELQGKLRAVVNELVHGRLQPLQAMQAFRRLRGTQEGDLVDGRGLPGPWLGELARAFVSARANRLSPEVSRGVCLVYGGVAAEVLVGEAGLPEWLSEMVAAVDGDRQTGDAQQAAARSAGVAALRGLLTLKTIDPATTPPAALATLARYSRRAVQSAGSFDAKAAQELQPWLPQSPDEMLTGPADVAAVTGAHAATGGAGAASGSQQGGSPPVSPLLGAVQPLDESQLRRSLADQGPYLTDVLMALSQGLPPPPPPPPSAAAGAGEGPGGAAAGGVEGGLRAGRVQLVPPPLPLRDGRTPRPGRGSEQSPPHAPPSAVEDRVNFVVNNLTDHNMSQKVQELRSVIQPQHMAWLAHYLVTQRVASQPNFHPLYAQLLQRLDSAQLNEEVLTYTFSSVQLLLASRHIRSSSKERGMLKHFGSWLGRITIGSDKPLLFRDLDLQGLIFRAYENGSLIACVPFAVRVLEAANQGTVFRPPNPWTMTLLALIREIHEVKDLKLNLKFEAEMVAKALNVSLNDVPRTQMLDTCRRPQLNRNPDFNLKEGKPSGYIPGQTAADLAQKRASARPSTGAAEELVIPGLMDVVQVGGAEELLPLLPDLRRRVALAVDKAVRSVLMQLVPRSSNVSVTTSNALVRKDFATTANDQQLAAAGNLMASHLAGSLAMVMAREPIRAAIAKHISADLESARAAKPAANGTAAAMTARRRAVRALAAANASVGSALVEKAAMERATNEIDAKLSDAVRARHHHTKERGPGAPFQDLQQIGPRWPADLPQALQPSVRGLTEAQRAVYLNFDRSIVRRPVSAAPAEAAPEGSRHEELVDQAIARFRLELHRLDAALKPQGAQGVRLASLPPNHKVRQAADAVVAVRDSISDPAIRSASATKLCPALLRITVSAARRTHGAQTLTLDVLLSLISSLAVVPKVVEGIVAGVAGLPHPTTSEEVVARVTLLSGLAVAGALPPASLDGILSRLATPPPQPQQGQPPQQQAQVAYAAGLSVAAAVVLRTIFHAQVVAPSAVPATYEALSRAAARGTAGLPDRLRSLPSLMAAWRHLNARKAIPPNVLAAANECDVVSPVLVGGAQAGPAGAGAGAGFPGGAGGAGGSVVSTGSQGAAAAGNGQAGSPELVVPDTERGRRVLLLLLERWARITSDAQVGRAGEAQYREFLLKLRQHGLLASDAVIEALIRVMMDLSIQSCAATAAPYQPTAPSLADGPHPTKQITYIGVDALARLVALLVKVADSVAAKVRIVSRVLFTVTRKLLSDAERRGGTGNPPAAGELAFDQRPYLRMFANLLRDSQLPEQRPGTGSPEAMAFNAQVLQAFADVLHASRPDKVPGFAFGWLQIVSHRMLLPRLLGLPGQRAWPLMHRLLLGAFGFLSILTRSPTGLDKSGSVFYKGVLRMTLVIMNDFPAFLSDYHHSLCCAIPLACVHLRNIVLAAFPKHIRMPDPLTQDLKIGELPEVARPPRMLLSVDSLVQPAPVRAMIDAFVEKGGAPTIPQRLVAYLSQPQSAASDGGPGVPGVGAPMSQERVAGLVLYIGVRMLAVLNAAPRPAGTSPVSIRSVTRSPGMGIFRHLLSALEPAGRHLLLTAVVNQLRYPNSHTHLFCCVLLILFGSARSEGAREQLARVLLERLITHRPHPWGLLITFIELVKNPDFRLQEHNFIQCSPSIRQLFDRVVRSCTGGVAGAPPQQ